MPKGPGESGCYSEASPSIVITRMWTAAMFAYERASGSLSNLRREGWPTRPTRIPWPNQVCTVAAIAGDVW